MLFRIKLISDEVEAFLREFLIESDATFLELNRAILDSCGYPDDQITSFYLCDEEWERKTQVTREDMSLDGSSSYDEDIYVMESTRLNEFIEDEDQKLEFVYDPFAERMFYLDVVELIPGKHLAHPELVRSVGEAPRQIETLDVSDLGPKKGAVPTDELFDETEFYGTDSFNNDEFDPEGFEMSDDGYSRD